MHTPQGTAAPPRIRGELPVTSVTPLTRLRVLSGAHVETLTTPAPVESALNLVESAFIPVESALVLLSPARLLPGPALLRPGTGHSARPEQERDCRSRRTSGGRSMAIPLGATQRN